MKEFLANPFFALMAYCGILAVGIIASLIAIELVVLIYKGAVMVCWSIKDFFHCPNRPARPTGSFTTPALRRAMLQRLLETPADTISTDRTRSKTHSSENLLLIKTTSPRVRSDVDSQTGGGGKPL